MVNVRDGRGISNRIPPVRQSDPPEIMKVLKMTTPSPPAGRLPTARSRSVAPEVERPPRTRPAEGRALGVHMTDMHDWDAGSVLTLILGVIGTAAIFAFLVWGFINGD